MTKRGLVGAIALAAFGLVLFFGSFYQLNRVTGFDVRNLPEAWRVPIMLLLGTPFASGICLGSAVTLFLQARRAAKNRRDEDAAGDQELSARASGEPMETLER